MNVVTGLAAFAGTMAVLSTVVTVFVQLVHKVMALRLAGLHEMLRAIHDDMLQRLMPEDQRAEQAPRASNAAVSFARSMTTAPSASVRPWYVRTWPILGYLTSPRFERMSTLQFVEQLAQTPQGRRLAQLDGAALRSRLVTLAYQFERLGESQLDYFRKRAQVVSVLVAVAFAAAANVDAFTLFTRFLNNSEQAAAVVAQVQDQRLDNLTVDARLAIANLEARVDSAQDGAPASAAVREDLQSLGESLRAIQGVGREASESGLPIGGVMFPFCGAPSIAAAASTPGQSHPDARCAPFADHVILPLAWDKLAWKLEHGWLPTPDVSRVSAPAPEFLRRMFSWDGATWFFGVICAAGLLGLGAPFWFDIFRTLAALAGPRAGPRPEQAAEEDRPDRYGRMVRDARASDADTLHRGFLIAMGEAPPDRDSPQPGGRVGPASADAAPRAG